MENTFVKGTVIVLAVIGALTVLGSLAMAIGCGLMGPGMMSGMMDGTRGGMMGGMMGRGMLGVLLLIAVIAVIAALVVFLLRRK